jgi:glucose-6-phosphate isomerase
VLHTALRRPVGDKLSVNGVNVMPEVHKVLNQITELVGRIHDGLWRGYTEKPITDVVNIGIGGSFLGPELVSEALLPYAQKGVRCHYLANIDGSEFHELTANLRAETTLFIVSSKSFNTLETLKNARPPAPGTWPRAARKPSCTATSSPCRATTRPPWPSASAKKTSSRCGTGSAGVTRCGRPSVCRSPWPSACQLQGTAVRCLHHGPALPDRAVRQNMPVLLALLGVWYGNFWGAQEPRDPAVRPLPAQHHQALAAAGHGIQRQERAQDGTPVKTDTGPVIWGGVGCNGQHAYHQLLHQGTQLIPADFIVPVVSFNPVADHHQWLYANCLSQSQALMLGKTREEAEAELRDKGLNEAESQSWRRTR